MALSTLKPSTSPHLSFVHLRFTHLNPPSETWNPENMGNDLQQIADELSRIEREYEGAVALSVFRDMEFGRLDTLNVRLSFLWSWMRPHCEIIGSFLAGPSALGSLRCDLDNPSSFGSPNWLFCGVELFIDCCRSSFVGVLNGGLTLVSVQLCALPSPCLPRNVVFLLNTIDICCSLARSGGNWRRSTLSDCSQG